VRGHIRRRGRRSWQLKYDAEPIDGRRQIRYATVKGLRQDAERELARILHEVHSGTHVAPDAITVGDWLTQWLAKKKLSARSLETYQVHIARLTRAIGSIRLQKLKPVDVHNMVLTKVEGTPVAPSTARNGRRVLKAALQAAFDLELVSRNVATSSGSSVAAEDGEVHILGPTEIASVLASLLGTDLYQIAALALATGMRRGELLALRWQDIDLELAVVRVERSLTVTTARGYEFKSPKTRAGRRAISVPSSTVDMLRDHRRRMLELRMQLGMGKPDVDALVFCRLSGEPLPPNHLTHKWRQAVRGRWKFHALRHTHASALISAGLDIVTISRRLGHSSPTITLRTYAHLFADTGRAAADAIGKVLGDSPVTNGC
jgi:integrase